MNKRTLILAVVLLGGLFILLWLFWPQKPNPWQPTTQSYKANCGADCAILTNVIPGHKGNAMPLVYDPKIDDATAQWGDCLEDVMQCVHKTKSFKKCVNFNTSCPTICVEKFESKAKNVTEFKQQRKIFENIFIDDNALCLPEDREIQ